MIGIGARRALLLFTSLSTTACASAGASEDPGRPPLLVGLPAIVDSVRNTPPLDRTHWGVGAYDYDADRMLLRVNVDRHFVPASNMKLLVTAAALGLLGPDFRYSTVVQAEDLRDGTAASLVVRGAGDPTLSARFYGEPLAALAQLADSIVASGVRRVHGPLVVDATYFDAQHVHPTWETGDLGWYYAAPVAAFAVEEGTLSAVVGPGATVGAPATVDLLTPSDVVVFESTAVTDTAFSENTIEFARDPETNTFRFSGRVPLNAEADAYDVTVPDPAAYAGQALAELLRERGVEISEPVLVLNQGTPEAQAPRWYRDAPGFTTVATMQSPRMAEIVEAILEPSQNWIAEQVLKTLGAERGEGGSWRAGAEVERRWLIDVAGLDSAALHIVDGSGLSAQNLLTPDAIMRLLYHASEQDWGPIYRAAMAEPGEEGSTLENRLHGYGGRVFAKTGTITHVNSLSGYLIAADGREIIFSVLSNASGVPSSFVRSGIDRIVEALAAVGTPAPVVPERRLTP